MHGLISLIYRMLGLRTIARQLFFWVFLLIFLSSCLYLLSYTTFDKKKRLDETEMNLQYALTNQRLIMENWAAERAKEIRYLANLPVSKERQLEQMNQTFQNFLQTHEELVAIVYLDEDGFVTIDSASNEGVIHSDVSLKDRDYFKAGQQGKEYMYDVVVSKASDKPVIVFSAPVYSTNDQFQGVIFGAAHLSKVNDLLSASTHGESGEIILINQETVILTQLSENINEEFASETIATKLHTDIANKILTQETSTVETNFISYVNDQGDDVFGSFVPLFDGRYFLINEISKKEVLQSHYQMIMVMLSISMAILILGMLLIIPVSRHLLRPLSYLVEAINEIKMGNYNSQLAPQIFKSSPLELQQFIKVFDEMSATIQEKNKILQNLSSTDELTGIANRRTFNRSLEREWTRAEKEQAPLSVAFLDIDFLKEINDTFGHQVGDHCLKNIAHTIKHTINRPKDIVARYGGDEFVILLPETHREEAAHLAEKVRKQIEILPIPTVGNKMDRYATVSIGVAILIPSKTMNKESLVQLADQALYEAKSKGKNSVITKSI